MDYSPWGHKELDTTERLSRSERVEWGIFSFLCFFFLIKIVYLQCFNFWYTAK